MASKWPQTTLELEVNLIVYIVCVLTRSHSVLHAKVEVSGSLRLAVHRTQPNKHAQFNFYKYMYCLICFRQAGCFRWASFPFAATFLSTTTWSITIRFGKLWRESWWSAGGDGEESTAKFTRLLCRRCLHFCSVSANRRRCIADIPRLSVAPLDCESKVGVLICLGTCDNGDFENVVTR